MHVHTEVTGSTVRAVISDRMTFSDTAVFRSLLNAINKDGVTACIFDLSGLEMIDSSGLGMLMLALDEGKKAGWTLTLRSPQGQVDALLKLARFDKLLPIEH